MPGRFFSCLCFFVGIEKNSLIEKFRIATKIANHSHPPKSTKSLPVGKNTTRRKEENWDRTKIGVGTSVTVKVGQIGEKIREGESRSKRKERVDTPSGWTTSASVLVYALYPFNNRTPTALLQPHDKRPTP